MTHTDSHSHAIVLAGGSGQRFWPLSRELNPKQLLSVFGTESLIAQAIHRVHDFVEDDSVWVVTNERLFDELRNHLTAQPDPRLRAVRYLLEPVARNTAPAIALAAAVLERSDPDALMIVLPSDHVLESGPVWDDCLAAASALARDGYLVTVGIAPTRPETGYGYIRAGAGLEGYSTRTVEPRAAERFVEKPDRATAESYLRDGSYFWNAGIFVMRAARVLDELESAEADVGRIAEVCRWMTGMPASDWVSEEVRLRFGGLPSVSLDHAVMERADKVAVIPATLAWSDVGSLLSLGDVATPDEAGVVRVGRGADIGSSDSIVFSTDRLVATLGISGLIVVDTADATLVCAKDRVQDVRLIVEALKATDAEEVVQPRTSLRPWGSWTSLLKGPGFQIKMLEIKPGAQPSLQRHHHRSEHWVVVSGTARVTRDAETIEVHANESVFIPVGASHRIENCGKVPLKVIEVQVGEYLGEDDIVRLEDDWHREERS